MSATDPTGAKAKVEAKAAAPEPPEDENGLAAPFPCDGQVIGQCAGSTPADTTYIKGTCTCEDGKPVHPYYTDGKAPDFFCETKRGFPSWDSCAWGRTFDHEDVAQYPNIRTPFNHDISASYVSERKDAMARIGARGFKVLHDLDDTVICSGGKDLQIPLGKLSARFLNMTILAKGIDRQLPEHTKYPGVGTFFYALTVGRQSFKDVLGGVWPDIPRELRPTPMTARPYAWGLGPRVLGLYPCDSSHGKDFDFAMRAEVCGCPSAAACASGACECFGEHVDPSGKKVEALYGSVDSPMSGDFQYRDGVTTRQFPWLAWNKYSSWVTSVLPAVPRPAIFVGDNGQGDLQAAEMMMTHSKTLPALTEGAVEAAFIHDVRQQCPSGPCRENWKKQDVYFFSNYREAADMAYEAGIIEAEARDRVLEAYRADMTELEKTLQAAMLAAAQKAEAKASPKANPKAAAKAHIDA